MCKPLQREGYKCKMKNKIDQEKCTMCGLCFTLCKIGAIERR
ncbi:4Fe-4S binding protein [bacterium]|nr:4Fe-4S binding protein [bacterium]MBU1599294.1 4Fe-4S binding protein [bacterium]MBU2461651.1 4Fe-4S binding protein [bacterium]